MNSRDELAGVIDNVNDVIGLFTDERNKIADAVLAAGYVKPRVITTVDELDALPDGSVIQANNGKGAAAIREDRQWYMPNPFYKWEYDSAKVTLPAIVLFEPDEESN
jgi:hypothetical protein